ncbi:MAG: protoporphyrinogen oxidase [Catenulispora sp.]|nr:protoporphyrinogen oxidase [Catenulispora sp.]
MQTDSSEAARDHGHRHAGWKIAVVGGGISGLAAAWFAKKAMPDAGVVLFEGSPSVGGKLALGQVGGVGVDLGAEAILNLRPEAVDLVRAVGLDDDVVHPETTAASLWNRGELVPMPKGHLLGIPGDVQALEGLLSSEGLARAAEGGRVEPARDISVGEYAARTFGREVVDRLVEPLLDGIYAGHADEISLRATIPALIPALESGKPLGQAVADILGGHGAAPKPKPTPVFAGIRGGIGRFPVALAQDCERLGVTIRRGTAVGELSRTSGGWRLVADPAGEHGGVYDFDAVVVAVPAPAAAKLLADVAPTASAELAGIEYAAVALATYVFDGAVPLAGSGFLVPPVDGRFIKASTFSSSKWAWPAESGKTVVRASVGRHRETAALQYDDAEIAKLALADLHEAIGPVLPEPIDWRVQRWDPGLPQYTVGHVDRVARIRDDIARQPGIVVCGAAYDGVGIAPCVASALRAVRELVSSEA